MDRTVKLRNRLSGCAVGMLALLLLGCVHDDDFVESDGYVYLDTDVRTFSAASEDANTLGAAEYTISRVRLYAFDGNKLDNMVYIDNIPANLGVYSTTFKVKQATNKSLYVVVNEPDNAAMHSRLALINHPAAFAAMEYEMASYMTKVAYNSSASFGPTAFCLPAFGQVSGINAGAAHTASAPLQVSMTATRSLARVDVMMQKTAEFTQTVAVKSATVLKLVNTRSGGYIAPDNVASGSLVSVDNAATGPATDFIVPQRNAGNNNAAVRAFSFYTPERLCSTSATKLGFHLEDLYLGSTPTDFDVTIGNETGNTLGKIERNKVHKVYLTFTPKSTEIQLSIKDWDDVPVPGDIIGNNIGVSQSRVVMDWWDLGFSFTTSVNFSSTEQVSFVGYFKDGALGETKLTTLPTWLTITRPTMPATSGTFQLSYTPTGGDDVAESNGLHDDILIRLERGNITKDIRVVYDNGFLPEALLNTTWTYNRPEVGLHVAKKGNLLPTETATTDYNTPWATVTTSVASAQNKGYGYGVLQTSAIINALGESTAAFQCRELGTRWFLPSLWEFNNITTRRNWLGPSYAVQNNTGYITSTENASSTAQMLMSLYSSTTGYAVSKSYTSSYLRAACHLGGLFLSAENLVADWYNWGKSFTTYVDYESWDGPLTSVTHNGVLASYKNTRNWLSTAEVYSADTRNGVTTGKIKITYTPTEGNGSSNSAYNTWIPASNFPSDPFHSDITVTVKTANCTKTINVKYDNGYLPPTVLKWIYGTTVLTQPNGIHVAKRGNLNPLETARQLTFDYRNPQSGTVVNTGVNSSDYQYQWAVTGKKGTYVEGAAVTSTYISTGTYQYGRGQEYTKAIVDVLGADAPAAWACYNGIGRDWYVPTSSEINSIFLVKNFMGPSYMFTPVYGWEYWSSIQKANNPSSYIPSAYYIKWDPYNPTLNSVLGDNPKDYRYYMRCVRTM